MERLSQLTQSYKYNNTSRVLGYLIQVEDKEKLYGSPLEQINLKEKAYKEHGFDQVVLEIVKNEIFRVGRNKFNSDYNKTKNDLVLDHPSISGLHCLIWSVQFSEEVKPLIYIKDVSLNGCFINGEKLGYGNIYLFNQDDVLEIKYGIKLVFKENFKGKFDKEENNLLQVPGESTTWIVTNKLIGSGTFGQVFVAKNTNHKHKFYAVKTTTVHPNNNILSKREAEILLKLDHPNIIKVHDAVCSKDRLFIFQSLIHGGDLFSYLAKSDVLMPLNQSESLIITYQIIMALKYLHGQNIIHRDLKLDNILLKTPEPYSKILLTDFGTAKSLPISRTYTVIGTPEYSAPEVGFRNDINYCSNENGNKGYGKPCDMWSLGIILHIMLSGISPFYVEDGDPFKIVEASKKGKLNFHLPQWQHINDHAKDLISKLLSVNHYKRLTINQAFLHPWISGHAEFLSSIYQKILDNDQDSF